MPPHHIRRRRMSVGGFDAVKLGVPSGFADLYYSLMEVGWPSFVALVTAAYLVINLGFGLLYTVLPGAIANAAPGSLADGFFFSVETLGTVGYGNMAPATHLGHSIAAIEILVGLFFSATMTGLIFARFARPRDSLIFSRFAVVGRYDGRRALMVRMATARSRPLAAASAQISWLMSEQLDGRVQRRLVELPLLRATNPLLGLAWTLVHFIETDSPMYEALCSDDERFQIVVSIGGLDTLLASQAISGHVYRRNQILLDHDYEDMIDFDGGMIHLDLTRLHSVSPLAALEVGGAPEIA